MDRSSNGSAGHLPTAVAPGIAAWLLAAFAFLSALAAPAVLADVFYVTPEGAGAMTGVDWANAFASVQDAIDAAKAAGVESVVKVKDGTYAPAAEICASNLTAALTIRGGYAGVGEEAAAEPTILTRGAAGREHVVKLQDAAVALERLTVTGGFHANPISGGATEGLGIWAKDVNLVLRDCTVSSNIVYRSFAQTYRGGGLCCRGGSLLVEDSRFVGNSVGGPADYIGCFGGGVFVGNCPSVVFRGSTFDGNKVRAHYISNKGGALFLSNCASAAVTNCVFLGNWVQKSEGYSGRDNGYGGAICAEAVGGLLVADSHFARNGNNSRINNSTYGLRGGTIYLAQSAATIRRTSFYGNGRRDGAPYPQYDSGSIYLASGSLKMENVLQAACAYGNGLEAAGGTVEAVNCTFADLTGGAGYHQLGAAAASFKGCVFADCAGGAYTLVSGTAPTFSYCCAPVVLAGVGNYALADVQFADRVHYHPKSEAGAYVGGYFSGGDWIIFGATSETIDTGDAAAPWADEPQPNRHRANVGYDAGTSVASKSKLGSSPVVDPAELKVFSYPVQGIGVDCATASGEVASTGGGANPALTLVWDAADRGTASIGAWANAHSFGPRAPWDLVSHQMAGLSGQCAYRFVAENALGAAWSDAVAFALAAPPSATLDSITHVTRHGARVAGTLVSDGGTETTVRLRVVRQDGTGEPVELGFNSGNPVASGGVLSWRVSGLEPNVAYVFAVVASNAVGVSSPSDARTTCSTNPVVRYVAPQASGLGDGSDWANAYRLNDAFDECLYAGDEIRMLAGTYFDYGYNNPDDPSSSALSGAEGLTVRGGFTGEGDAVGEAETILDRDPSAQPTPFRRHIAVSSSTVRFENLVFTNAILAVEARGQSVWLSSSAATFSGCRFRGNLATELDTTRTIRGGAIAAVNGSLAVTNCVFSDNGVFIPSDNSSAFGGAIYAHSAAVEIDGCAFLRNRVGNSFKEKFGGALALNGGTARVRNSTFVGNYAIGNNNYTAWTRSGGGAVAINPDAAETGSFFFEGCTFDGCYMLFNSSAFCASGVVSARGSQQATVFERCVFRNSGPPAGCGYAAAYWHGEIGLAGGVLAMTNCVVGSNMGGDNMVLAGGQLDLVNCTVANSAAHGLFLAGAAAGATLHNSIVWANATGGVGGAHASNAAATYCDVQGDAVFPGEGNILADPKFRDAAADNYVLRPSSPAAGAGLDADWMGAARDVAGMPRRRGRVDMGAHETQVFRFVLFLK